MIYLLLLLGFIPGDLVSGPQPGKKFGPYTFLLATGPNRGTSHCYVCETGDAPAVIVLARSTSDTLGDFLKQLDRHLAKPEAKELKAWVTFVGMKQPQKEPELVGWSKKLGLRTLPLGIYELTAGPPSYKLHQDADITILLVKESKVVHNHAFANKGLTAGDIRQIMEKINSLSKK
jgi:hypothetical protein